MTDNLGTLAGLITDLEGRHTRSVDPMSEFEYCAECNEPGRYRRRWPCPTIELTRKHKRGQWRLGEYSSSKDVPERTHFVMNVNRGGYPPFDGTEAECEAWIDRQVNGDA